MAHQSEQFNLDSIRNEILNLQAFKDDVGKDSCENDLDKLGTGIVADTISSLQHKLHVESEISATLDGPLLKLPENPNLLKQLATEKAEEAARKNARTLEVYKSKLEAAEEEKQKYTDMVNKATLVNEKLSRLLSREQEENPIVAMKRKYDRSAVGFKVLRSELQFLLNTFYPPKDNDLSLEELMERLVTKMLEDPNDPYLTINEEMLTEHIAFLIQANLITRHHSDVTRIRFMDFRN